MSEYQEPPRPARSLRDRLGARRLDESELPPSDYIEKKVIESPEDFSNGQDYLDEIDSVSDENDFDNISVDEEDDPIPALDQQSKPKVQILNVRENRKEKEKLEKISTESLKQEAKKQIKENVDKVKSDFQEIEESFEDTKEEIAKITDKVTQEAQIVKAKVMFFGIQAMEKLLNAPKALLMGLVFKKKKQPVVKEVKSNNPSKSNNEVKKLPKIKYADLLAQNIDFLAYDKKRFVDAYDTGTLLEEIFMSNVISDIKYCVKYVTDLPTPNQGIYKDRKIAEIFENVTSEDINRFLYYVINNPETFKRNKYKFSEAFATWVLKKSQEL